MERSPMDAAQSDETDLDRHLAALAQQQPTDFRAANLFKLVGIGSRRARA